MAPQLSKWYKKVRIDSFSKGSVLVDYYVELANITKDVDTLEIKKLFHEALKPQPILPHKPETENETDNDEDSSYQDIKEEKLVKETFLMGKYVIDPVATDFSGNCLLFFKIFQEIFNDFFVFLLKSHTQTYNT